MRSFRKRDKPGTGAAANGTPGPTVGAPSSRILFLLLGLLCAAWALITIQQAWRATQAREAFLPQLEELARQEENNGRLSSLLGARLAQAGDYGDAIRTLKHAIASGDNDPLVWQTMAGSAAAGDNFALAMGILAAGIRQNIPGLQDIMERARGLGRKPRAADLANAILPQGPGQLVVLRARGSFLNGLSEWWGRRHPDTSGFATREAWVQEEPEDAEAQRLWGEALTINRQFSLAAAALNRALALAPRSPKTHLAAAHLWISVGLEDKAAMEYQECLQVRPGWLPALLGAGQVALNKRLVFTAISLLRQAVKEAPESPDAWIGLGRAYLGPLLTSADALAAFRKVEHLAPGRSDYFDDYSNALVLNYHLDEAESLLRRRLQAAQEDYRAHYLLARLLLQNKPTPKRQAMAEDEIRRVLQLSPRNPEAQTFLARLLLARNRLNEAIALLKDASSRAPFNVDAAATLARAYRQAGQLQEADQATARAAGITRYVSRLQVLQDSLQHNPADPDVHLNLSRLYASTGQNQKARSERDIASWLHQHSSAARSNLTTLTIPGLGAVVPGH